MHTQTLSEAHAVVSGQQLAFVHIVQAESVELGVHAEPEPPPELDEAGAPPAPPAPPPDELDEPAVPHGPAQGPPLPVHIASVIVAVLASPHICVQAAGSLGF